MNEFVLPKDIILILSPLILLQLSLVVYCSIKIFREWLPSSGYEYADAPDIEVYFEGNQQAEDYRCEVCLPVEKK